MTYFKPLNTKKYQKTGAEITPDNLYWKRLGSPTLVKEFGAIDYIDFSCLMPYYFAVTSSVRVQIYNPITKLVVKNLSRFQETAYGGNFRQDGRLLVSGEEQGLVKIFDTTSRSVLRLFKGHRGPVHRAYFTTDLLHIASYSDDRSVRLWDISTEKTVQTYAAHNDYVRAGAINPMSNDVLLSGGYDGKINIYDTRTKTVTHTVDHGSPVEALLFLPSGGILLSAGGTEVRVWDAVAGCRLLTKLSQHHKTVTCLHLASEGKRFMSGGLDRHVKIYDVASYQPVHTLDYPNAVLSLGVAPNDSTVAVGMVDGLISVRNMESADDEKDLALGGGVVSKRKKRRMPVKQFVQVDHEVALPRRVREKKYDLHLRRYEYVEALDFVLQMFVAHRKPEVTVGVMQELIARKGLHRALAGRTHASLTRIIIFIARHIGEARFMRVLIAVAATLLDVYEELLNQMTPQLQKEFQHLNEVLERETRLTYDLLELQGALELLTCAANVTTEVEGGGVFEFVPELETNELTQSANAEHVSVLAV